jgi:uncharacterized protein YecE (DUF72 family)
LSRKGKIYIGTSGWHYGHWKGPLYPKETSSEDFLMFYAKQFQTTEINNTFYQLPTEKTMASWRDTVPDGFVFSIKASRYITHMKKLKDPEESTRKFFSIIEVLGDKAGPVLFQLPPKWKVNLDRLEEFLDALPGVYRYSFEFRDTTWFGQDTENLLVKKKVAFCIYDFDGRQSPRPVTTDFIYIRLHGPEGAYRGKYDKGALSDWTEAISTWAGDGKDVYCYFDNDQNGYAPQNALSLIELLEDKM